MRMQKTKQKKKNEIKIKQKHFIAKHERCFISKQYRMKYSSQNTYIKYSKDKHRYSYRKQSFRENKVPSAHLYTYLH